MLGFAVWGFTNGNTAQFMAPYDGHESFCGYDMGFENYPYLYLKDLEIKTGNNKGEIFKTGVCVEKCPKACSGQNKPCEIKTPSEPAGKIVVDIIYNTTSHGTYYCIPIETVLDDVRQY